MNIKPPAVAGYFYPAEPQILTEMLSDMLDQEVRPFMHLTPPKAIIVPHAGYIYSGTVAASVYQCLKGLNHIQKVVMLGPAHRVGFRGIATTSADVFKMPMGLITIDKGNLKKTLDNQTAGIYDLAFEEEHCLEVQLPFLQRLIPSFTYSPFLVGDTSPEQVALLLKTLWGGPETLVVISSDLSHYHPYNEAMIIDAQTNQAILSLDPSHLKSEQACGCLPIQGLLIVAKELGLTPTLVDLKNSGDTAGNKDKVVGYGAYHFASKESI